MATYQTRRWTPSFAGATRVERGGCDYRVYIPDALVNRLWRIDGDVAADIADAEAAILRFNERAGPLSDTEGLARLLLRAEAVASSRIEGLVAGPRRVLRAEAAEEAGEAGRDVGAEEILGNIRAMQRAVADSVLSESVTVDTVCDIHRELLHGAPNGEFAGTIRTEQNWIGGNSYNPCGAAYVPPPPELVPDLLTDLCTFTSGDALPPLVQAGIAHAQFETIHPFADGNGRTGRALIHLILVRRGLAPRFIPPISLVLARWSDRYIAGLEAFRHTGPAEGPGAVDGVNAWLATFASATLRAVVEAEAYERQIGDILREWEEQLGSARKDSATHLLLRTLPRAPVLSVRTAQALIQRSFEATNRAVMRLEAAGILRSVTVGKRNRVFEAGAIVDAFVALERGLGSQPAARQRE